MDKIELKNPDTLNIPDAVMIRPMVVAVFDNIKETINIMTAIYPSKNIDAQSSFNLANKKIITFDIVVGLNYGEKYLDFVNITKNNLSEEDKVKEHQQFQKSIVHPKTGIMSEKYNLDFFKQNEYLAYWCHKVGDKDFWQIWIKLN